MVGYLGYSPAGLERLRALVTDASERCAMFASGIDAVRLPDGVITPDVGALTRLQHTLETHFRSSIEAILASDAMTAIAPIPDELIDLAARRGITQVDVATLDDRSLLERLRAVIWVHTATGATMPPPCSTRSTRHSMRYDTGPMSLPSSPPWDTSCRPC